MRKPLMFALAATLFTPLVASAQGGGAGWKPATTNQPGRDYPQVDAEGRVRARVVAPDAHSVQLDIGAVKYPLEKTGDGAWIGDSDPQDVGFHYYQMVIDGAEVPDPNSLYYYGASRWGSGVEIPASDEEIYALRDVPHGRLSETYYRSGTSRSDRRIYVYTPPQYETEPDRRFPVLYLQHGMGENETGWGNQGRAALIMDNLIDEGKAEPMIIVMENGLDPGNAELPEPEGGGRRRFNFGIFERILIDDLIPFVDGNYRTLDDQPNRALAGLSMGGMQTRRIAPAHLDKFSHIGVFSGGSLAPTEIADMDEFRDKVDVVFFSSGSREGGGASARANAEAMREAGVDAHYYESPETAHEWQTWRRSLHRFAQLLFRDEPTTLKDAYADAFLMGTAVNSGIVTDRGAADRKIVLREFNTVTAENEMKAAVVNPRPGEFNFRAADEFVDFGEEHDLFIIGHTLVWHNQAPDWFFRNEAGEPVGREALTERMRSHIEKVAGRYKGRVDAWDVVNEVIDNDGSYRRTTWVDGIGDGDEMVKLAFKFASEYAPDAELYYNDFNAWRPAKRDGIVRMVKMLQDEGIRIDGVGIQGHWGLNFPKNEYIEQAIDAYAALGVKVMITELDVDVLPLTREGQIIGQGMSDPQFQLEEFEEFLDPYRDGLPQDVSRQLADRYAELFGIFHRKRDQISRVTLWGLHDGMSWKNGYPIPRRTNYTLLFDRQRQPKEAYRAVLSVPASVGE